MDRAVKYANERIQFGKPLIEKEGYAAKLIAPHWVDLEAGRAYMEEVADRIDAGEKDLQVEGSIAKLWCTETGNRAADAAIQALGGYGYAREYMVEKIRRDVRITTIYEGTSEIQQSIIGLYRWKVTVRSKGGFYEEMAAAMDALHAERGDLAADLIAGAIRDLNATILYCHGKRIASRQAVQFRLADMMTACEVATAFAKRTAAGDDADARAPMVRAYVRSVLAAVRRGAVQCVLGYTEADDVEGQEEGRAFLADLATADPVSTHIGLLADLGAVTESLKAQA